MHGAELSLGNFGTSAELSPNFMKGPKCPTDTSALVPNCLRSEVSWVRSVRTPVNIIIIIIIILYYAQGSTQLITVKLSDE